MTEKGQSPEAQILSNLLSDLSLLADEEKLPDEGVYKPSEILDKLINAQWKRLSMFLDQESTTERYNSRIHRDVNVLVHLLALRLGKEGASLGDLTGGDTGKVGAVPMTLPDSVIKGLMEAAQSERSGSGSDKQVDGGGEK